MKNGIMLQAFEWFSKDDGSFFRDYKNMAKELKNVGFTMIWMPPWHKGSSTFDVGYTSYDYYDLGEFDQKGSIRTKYGTKDELIDCVTSLQAEGIEVIADLVLNHKGSADFKEKFKAVKVDPSDREKCIEEARVIEAWTGFNFPGRKNSYSDFVWHHYHFSGIDFDAKTGESGIFKILTDNNTWNEDVSNENGNYDYLMFADIDHGREDVRNELYHAVDWMLDTTGVKGVRYDALKHISALFISGLTEHELEKRGDDFYFVGEYWVNDVEALKGYIANTSGNVDLFDVCLHFKLHEASTNPDFDLRTIFDNTLVASDPTHAVTFVDNHDTQVGSSLSSAVEEHFIESAYALILFREGGYPCIFAGHYFGIGGDNPQSAHKDLLNRMMSIRLNFAKGAQFDNFVTDKTIAWLRTNDSEDKSALVVLVSTGDMATVTMNLGKMRGGKIYVDASGKQEHEVVINEEGFGDFTVGPGQCSYWVEKDSI